MHTTANSFRADPALARKASAEANGYLGWQEKVPHRCRVATLFMVVAPRPAENVADKVRDVHFETDGCIAAVTDPPR